MQDLIDDLKLRINPAYADQRGTESYERRLCVEALEAQADEITKLRQQIQEQALEIISAGSQAISYYDEAERLRQQLDELVSALKEMMGFAGIIEERCDDSATNLARAALANIEGEK